MSVVNQMLRDLEQSQAEVKQLPLQSAIESGGNSRLIIGALLLLVVAALFYFGYDTFITPDNGASKIDLPQEFIAKPLPPAVESDDENPGILISENKSVPILPAKKEAAASSNRKLTSSPPLPMVKAGDKQTTVTSDTAESKKGIRAQKINDIKKIELASADNKISSPATKQKFKSQSRSTIIKKRFEKIKALNGNVSVTQTKSQLENLLQDASNFHPARLFLINLMWRQNDPQTNESIKTAIKLFPRESAYRLTAARFFINQSNLAEAESALIDVNEVYPSAAQLIQTRAVVRQKLGKHQLAIADYQSLLRLSPASADIYIALGISFGASGQTRQATASFERALADPRISQRQQQFIKNKLALYQG